MELLFGLIAISAAVVAMGWQLRRSRRILDEWAEAHGFEILEARYCWWGRGPFFFRSNEGHGVYRVTVRAADRQLRHGWVRCGGWFLGLWSGEVRVIWDQERGF